MMLADLHALAASPIGGFDYWMLGNRLVVGGFFAITGAHKLTVWRASTRETFQWFHDCKGLPFPTFHATAVPTVQLLAGLGVATGTLATLSAIGLIIVMVGALVLDGPRQIAKIGYESRLTWVNNLCFLPETLYVVMLGAVVTLGTGTLAIDGVVSWMLST